tara:strand:- start:70 stop:498 length:429 start_codon:yes stop_codon:yes gene_type:complete
MGETVAGSEDQIDGEKPEQSSAESEEKAVDALDSENAESEPDTDEPNAVEDTTAGDLKEKLLRVGMVVAFSVLLYFEVVYGVFIGVLICSVAYLLKGEVPDQVAAFVSAALRVVHSTIAFVLFQTDEKPWPLRSWPSEPQED